MTSVSVQPGFLELLETELIRDEAERLFVYDDANGNRIVPGTHVIGHPTIGTGRALDTHGISQEENVHLRRNDMRDVAGALNAKLPWFEGLDAVRKVVLASMAFQMGVDGLLAFHDTLAAVKAGAYAKAAQGMLESLWAKQTPSRAVRLAEMMRTGVVS